jgi:hypothetical protein
MGADFEARCHTYPASGRTPILSLRLGAMSVDLSPRTSSTDVTVTEADVAGVRELAEAVTAYLTEMERLYALSSAEPTDHANDESTTKPVVSGRAA